MATKKYLSVVDRYFTPRYKLDVNKRPGEDLCILTHSNKISLVTLAPSHPILNEKKEVIKVDFQVDKKTNRLENKVSGKSKRGAQNVSLTANLCHVTCSDQSHYIIPACMKGSLLEVNENLVKQPQLLTQKPSTEGYVAIILTYLQDHEAAMNKLLTQEQYSQVLCSRAEVTMVTNDIPSEPSQPLNGIMNEDKTNTLHSEVTDAPVPYYKTTECSVGALQNDQSDTETCTESAICMELT